MIVTAPAKSNRRPCSRSRLSRSSTGLSATTPSATGTLMKKIHSQPSPSVIGPPTSQAAVAPMPPIAAQMPSALLRSAPSSKVVVTIDSAVGVMIAAATPWTTRATISAVTDPASPQASEASANSAVPTMNTRRRPEQVGRAPAEQQQAAEAEQVGAQHPLQVPGREAESASIDGSATTTIAESRMTMKNAVQSSASAFQRRGSGSDRCVCCGRGGHGCADRTG